MSIPLPNRNHPLTKIILSLATLLLLAQPASAKTANVKNTKKAPPVFTGSYALAPIIPRAREEVIREALPPSHLLNFRFHPLHLAYTFVQKDTVLSLRSDLDFIIGNRFTLGPSVIYHHQRPLDEKSVGTNDPQLLDEKFWEIGVISNIYLTGETSHGGLMLRPHAYYIQPSGEKADRAATAITSGIRTGLEVVYQHILPCGLNFEIGAGATYYAKPYAIEYDGAGTARTEPGSLWQPTVTAGVGWAF